MFQTHQHCIIEHILGFIVLSYKRYPKGADTGLLWCSLMSSETHTLLNFPFHYPWPSYSYVLKMAAKAPAIMSMFQTKGKARVNKHMLLIWGASPTTSVYTSLARILSHGYPLPARKAKGICCSAGHSATLQRVKYLWVRTSSRAQ